MSDKRKSMCMDRILEQKRLWYMLKFVDLLKVMNYPSSSVWWLVLDYGLEIRIKEESWVVIKIEVTTEKKEQIVRIGTREMPTNRCLLKRKLGSRAAAWTIGQRGGKSGKSKGTGIKKEEVSRWAEWSAVSDARDIIEEEWRSEKTWSLSIKVWDFKFLRNCLTLPPTLRNG